MERKRLTYGEACAELDDIELREVATRIARDHRVTLFEVMAPWNHPRVARAGARVWQALRDRGISVHWVARVWCVDVSEIYEAIGALEPDPQERAQQTDPEVLLETIEAWSVGQSARERVAELTFAAEEAGKGLVYSRRFLNAFKKLLKHESPTVREGAVLGLAVHTNRKAVERLLRKVSAEDPSGAVRDVAKDALLSSVLPEVSDSR